MIYTCGLNVVITDKKYSKRVTEEEFSKLIYEFKVGRDAIRTQVPQGSDITIQQKKAALVVGFRVDDNTGVPSQVGLESGGIKTEIIGMQNPHGFYISHSYILLPRTIGLVVSAIAGVANVVEFG